MFCQSLALGLLGSRVAYALKEPYTLQHSHSRTALRNSCREVDIPCENNPAFLQLYRSFQSFAEASQKPAVLAPAY